MSKTFVLVLIFSVFTGAFAREFETVPVEEEKPEEVEERVMDILLQDPYMSDQYQKGKYLVYDCKNGHWVCTAGPEFERCQEEREISLKNNMARLACAPIKEFKNHLECVKTQVRLTDNHVENRFCLHPDERKKDLLFKSFSP